MVFGWPIDEIKKQIKKLTDKYLEQYPDRHKIPSKILNWMPTVPYTGSVPKNFDDPEYIKKNKKIIVDYETFKSKFGEKDFSKSEILGFQKQYLSFTIDSQMEQYKSLGNNIDTAKKTGILECIINNYELKTTKNGSKYCIMEITDGMRSARVNVWEEEYNNNKEFIKKSMGVIMNVSWDKKYKSFSVIRNGRIRLLDMV